jgi:hypothetical protein
MVKEQGQTTIYKALYIENKRSSNTNPNKNQSCTHVLRKGQPLAVLAPHIKLYMIM